MPEGIDLLEVRQHLNDLPGVADVHDLHVWAMSTTNNALTAHLVMASDDVNRDTVLEQAMAMLQDRFALRHVVLQCESKELASQCPLADIR